jgi:hypothetical protein
VRSTTSWRAEIDGNRFSGMIEIDGRFWALSEGGERYRVKVYCYVLMENHFHLVATTPEGNRHGTLTVKRQSVQLSLIGEPASERFEDILES